jgi:ABC-type amino acid transport substrate-binding protein
MRKQVMFNIGAVAGFCLLTASVLLGCGDKFVVLGRGARFQRVNASLHPASILIYMNPRSHVPAADKEFQLQSTLKLAGHKPAVVEDQGGLDRALKSGKYDLVLADLSDAATVGPEAQATTSKPAVIPIIYNPTGAELASAEKQYSCVVKASKKDHDLLAVIDEAMQSKAKGLDPKCQKGR